MDESPVYLLSLEVILDDSIVGHCRTYNSVGLRLFKLSDATTDNDNESSSPTKSIASASHIIKLAETESIDFSRKRGRFAVREATSPTSPNNRVQQAFFLSCVTRLHARHHLLCELAGTSNKTGNVVIIATASIAATSLLDIDRACFHVQLCPAQREALSHSTDGDLCKFSHIR